MVSIQQYYNNILYRYQNEDKFWRQCQILFHSLRYVTIGGVVFISLFLYFTSCVYAPAALRPFLLPCWFVSYKDNEAMVSANVPVDKSLTERSIDLIHLRNKAWESSPGYSIPLPLGELEESTRIMEQEWVLQVTTTVQSFPTKLATVIVLTNDLIEMFLNWLIFVEDSYNEASVLIDNLLVVSLDIEASNFLERYRTGHVQIIPDNIPLLNHSYGFSQSPLRHKIQTCKFMVAWLLNYLGYSALLIDLDAIILQDIYYMTNTYSEYDVIAGRDVLPVKLAEKWGDTVSTGFIFIKPTQQVEMLWHTLHLANSHAYNQQYNLNYAFDQLEISWHASINSKTSFGRGITMKGRIAILLLPETIVCRRCNFLDKDMLQEVKVFHINEPVELKDKIKFMQEFGHWKLRIDWRDCLGYVEFLRHNRLGGESVDSLVSKGVISRAQVGDSAKYKLVQPVSQIPEDILNEGSSGDEDSSGNENKDEDLSQPIRLVSYHRDSTLFVQCYRLIHEAGTEGLYLPDIIRSLPINQLIARRVPITLEAAGLVVSKLEDHHHHESKKLIRKFRVVASCFAKGKKSNNMGYNTHKAKQPVQKKAPKQTHQPSNSSPMQTSADVVSSPSSQHRPTHSRAAVPTQTPVIELSDSQDNSRQSCISEEITEGASQKSELFDIQDDSLLASEYSDTEEITADDSPVVPLGTLRKERGGVMFPQEELNKLLDLLSERFGSMDTEVKLSYVEPQMESRKLLGTDIYERRRADVIAYFKQKKVIIERVGLRAFLTQKDKEAGVTYKLDARTVLRHLSQLQIEGYIHQFLLEVTSEGSTRSDRVYLYHTEDLTSPRMVNKSEALFIRLTDRISWMEPAIRGPSNTPFNRDLTQALPKFQKLRALHIYLYLLVYGSEMEFHSLKELPYSWLNKIHQFPDTEDHGPGWINAAIALRCIPFSLFYALNAQIKDYHNLSGAIRDILSDPNKRDLPKAHVNFDKLGTGVSRLKRRYSIKYREQLVQLYEIGAIELEGGTKPGINKAIDLHLNLETVYAYIKPTLKLIDTSREAHGSRHAYFTNEARDYLPTYVIQLDTVADLDYYWLMADMISNSSKIVVNFDIRKKRNKKHQEFSLNPANYKNSARELDSLGFSAAGFPPSLFSNNKRNWSNSAAIKQPDPAVCQFNYSCNSLAYRAKNVVAVDPNKTDKEIVVPTPKLLVSQQEYLLKSRKRGKRKYPMDKSHARGEPVRVYSSNMMSFIRANIKCPEESGLMRKSLTRCSPWTQEENKKLLLCYITSVTLIKLLQKQVSTMVNIMSVLVETSRDKPTSAIRRNLRGLFKKTPMLHNYSDISIQDIYNDLKTHDSSEYTFENVYQYTSGKLSANPAAALKGEFKNTTTLLPYSYRELTDNYNINKLCIATYKLTVETESHKDEDTIKLFMLQDMILSTVSMYSGCAFESYTAYLMYNKFSSPLLRRVVTLLKQNNVLVKNKEAGSGDMRYKFKYLMHSRMTESSPLSCLLEPQLIPYSLSDIPLYSDNPDNSQTLITTLNEDIMLVSPADFYSLLKHLHSHPSNFRLDIELPYKIRKLGEESSCQFPLTVYERSAKLQKSNSSQTSNNPVPMDVDEIEDKKDRYSSTSSYFGFSKIDVMKCSDIVTLAVSDPWSTVEFETRELPPNFSCYPDSQIEEITWESYVKLATEYLHYTQSDVDISQSMLEVISEQKVLGVSELELIQNSSSCGDSGLNNEILIQNLVNFKLVIRAGTTEACLIAREYSDTWLHPLLGLDSIQSSEQTQATLAEQCVTCFRPWIGLISSDLSWNKLMLNQLTRSIHHYIATESGVSELSVLNYFHGFCQLRHLRDILQTLVDGGYIRRILIEEIGDNIHGSKKVTLFSKPNIFTMRQVNEMSNREPGRIFYEGIPGKDISGTDLMLQD
ncbi:General transcription factor 3C polypeptide 1-like [Oopsacas minuta]|uniref:General transcription factor 3C polypeptide 1-like n=1 Tax=Oopsacas minuta TaxID=111878 RepID=A0AAV7KHN7_9METZ|nr:General transcription factor 3C polypeptide 1-like [Oopsacas minuta]